MRPMEMKVFRKIGDDGITLYGIEEIIDSTDRTEMKKSYPDESHFQKPRYFARLIADSLLRGKLVEKRDGKLFKFAKKKTEKKED
ncbi:MAG: hypothetical protein K8S56_07250 [Candidatus Cloacimonetes bacterium]|nr:hypothetical protein [Candidatus Cloacimonadota bacterium]